MAFDYSDRGIWSLYVLGISPSGRDGEDGASTAVSIRLTGMEGPDSPGPKIDLEFAFAASHELSLRDLEREALATAAALLARFAKETPESLLEAAKRTRAKPQILSSD